MILNSNQSNNTSPPLEFFIHKHPVHSLTRIKTGGKCLYFCPVSTAAQLLATIDYAEQRKVPFVLLGKGCNVLMDDEEFNGIIIKLEGEFKSIEFNPGNKTVTAGAGTALMTLGHQIARRGYLGCSFFGVIPGTVGGAVRMNAGISKDAEMKHYIINASALDPKTGKIHTYHKDAMHFDYRQSIFSYNKKIIVQATFQLPENKETSEGEALLRIKELLVKRKAGQPKVQRTFGSVFKNPKEHPHSAGWYLDQAGMKEMRIGGAHIPKEHANWIVNSDNASSRAIKELITAGQKRVFEKFGIKLEREVVYLPEDIMKLE